MKQTSYVLTHFHKVETWTWLRTRTEQMDTAYLHQQRDAADHRLCQTIYGQMAISDTLADKVRSSILALRGQEKKPKSVSKFA